jgi:hypothetical protein
VQTQPVGAPDLQVDGGLLHATARIGHGEHHLQLRGAVSPTAFSSAAVSVRAVDPMTIFTRLTLLLIALTPM